MYKLLIVDDEPLTREFMRTNISSIDERWTVECEASDGQEAMDLLECKNVDLIITDIKMPVMDGLELCRRVSFKYPGQKVIILSGYDEFSFAREAIKYGTQEYLLKPIVREELKAALGRVTEMIEAERKDARAYNTLVSLSKDTKSYVIKKFLEAVVYGSSVQIKALYPLIYRMKVELMEGEGLIMILELDEEQVLEQSIPLSDISIYRYILNQTATEVMEDNKSAHVFLDANENTIIFLTDDSHTNLLNLCNNIFSRVSLFIKTNTNLTITGSVGSPVSDIQQLDYSYKQAHSLLMRKLISGNDTLYTYSDENDGQNKDFLEKLYKSLFEIQSGLLNNDERTCSIAVSNYADLICQYTPNRIYAYGLYMIKGLTEFKHSFSPEVFEMSVKTLKGITSNSSNISKDTVVAVFKNIISVLTDQALYPQVPGSFNESLNEQKIIEKAKDYIYSHYSEPISLALLAEVVGVSSSYLSQLFHKNQGEPYIKFLTRIRMEQAAKLLRIKPHEKISEISEKVGYLGVKHFIYVFKQNFGMTPSEYQSKT